MNNEMIKIIKKKYEKPQVIIEEYELEDLAKTGTTASADGGELDSLLFMGE